jgi:hypothetical protein
MVIWCKSCNALLGLREPFANWSTDRNGLCPACVKKEMDLKRLHPENDTAENAPLPPDPAGDTRAGPS